jgi:Tol biopolymer transport system component/DNA-binding winged helix-turn-helix (wHTH) protein
MENEATSAVVTVRPVPVTQRRRVTFGIFEADLSTGEMKKSGRRIRLQSQPFRVLEALLEKPGELVSRQELQLKVWGSDVVVDFEHGLGNAIRKIRDAIGDSAENPRFIETITRRGYRFIAPVASLPGSAEPSRGELIDPPPSVQAISAGTETTQTAASHDQLVHREKAFPGLGVRSLSWFLGGALCATALGVLGLKELLNRRLPFLPRISQVSLDGGVYPQGFRSAETLSPLAVDYGRIFSSSINQSSIVISETDVDTGRSRKMNLPAEVQGPEVDDISPDGTNLLVRSHSGVELQEPEEPLWVISTNGGSAFRISDILAHDATWLPDGKRILYATENRLETVPLEAGPSKLLYATENRLEAVPQEGGPSKLLAVVPGRPFWLRWSPDGKLLRFTIVDLHGNIYSLWELRADEHVAHRLSFGPKALENVCCGVWTSDGKFFVLQSTYQGKSDLWELKGNSTEGALQITNGPLSYTSPAAGREEQIFFQGVDSIAPVEEQEFHPSQKRFLPRTDFLQEAVRIVFSLDHQWVAWTDDRGHLWRARVDGSEKLQLTSDSIHVLNASWSTDDRTLAIMAKYPNRGWQVFWISQSGGKPASILPQNEQVIGDPTFSPDGKSLAFGGLPILMGGDTGNHPPIRVLDLSTKRVEDLPDSTNMFSPRWSPDGRYIAALTLDQQKLMLYDVAMRSWKVAAKISASDPLWGPDGKSLYFYASVSDSRPIYQISIPNLEVRQIYRPDCGHHNCILSGISPDDRPLIRVELRRSNIFSIDLGRN